MRGNDKRTICRLCLTENVELLGVYEFKGIPGWTADVAITELLRLQVSPCDRYPQSICVDCMKKLEEFKLFKQQCVLNQNLLDRAFAGNREIADNMEFTAKVFSSDENQRELYKKEEDAGILIKIDPLNADEGENPIKTEIGISHDYSNATSPAEVIEMDGQVFITTKNIFEEHERTVQYDQIKMSPDLSALTMNTSEETPDMNSPLENIFDASDNYMKEEIVDIKPESDSDSSYKEGIEGIQVEESAELSLFNTDGIKGRIKCSSQMSCDVPNANPSQPMIEDEGPIGISSLPKTLSMNASKHLREESNPVSTGNEVNSYGCDFSGGRFTHSDNVEDQIGGHVIGNPFNCELCKGKFNSIDSLKEHRCIAKARNISRATRKPMVCGWCSKEFPNASKLHRHEMIHTGDRPFRCNQCNKGYIEKYVLLAHMRSHSGTNPFKCDVCSKTFSLKHHLKSHMMTHSKERSFKCTVCAYVSTHSSNLRRHMIVHSEGKTFDCLTCGKRFVQEQQLKMHLDGDCCIRPYKCYHCSKTFKNKSVLATHMFVHSTFKPFKCENCGKLFIHKRSLKTHMQIHSGLKPFKCYHCGKTFTHKYSLRKHVRTHSGFKPFKCNQCSKEFAQGSRLKTHMKTHSGEEPFSCVLCHKAFLTKNSFKIHMTTHSREGPFKCSQCGKTFPHKDSLKKHSIIHSGKRPFTCLQCKKAFHFLSQLKKHIRSHSGERPFKCMECKKDFIQNNQLEKHMTTHSVERSFKCPECSKAFRTEAYLKRHMVIHSEQ